MKIKDLLQQIEKWKKKATSNLAAWKQVATSPSLRQDYFSLVAKPAAKKTYARFAEASERQRPQTARDFLRIASRGGGLGPIPQAAYYTTKLFPKTTLPISHFAAGMAGPVPAEKIALGRRLPEREKYTPYRAAGGATAALIAGGPSTVIRAGAIGGALGGVTTAMSNILRKKPITTGIGRGAVKSALYGLETAPTYVLTGRLVESMAKTVPFLKPLTEKGIAKTLPQANQTIGTWLKSLGKTGLKRMIKATLIETPIEGITYGIKDQKEKQRLVDSIAEQTAQNFIYNVGFAGVNTLWDARTITPIVRRSLSDAIQRYRALPREVREGGYIRIKGKAPAVKDEDILGAAREQIGKYEPPKRSFRQKLEQFYTDWVNRFYPIEKVTGKIEKDLKVKILPEKSPVYAIKRLLGAGGTASLRHRQKLEPVLKTLDNANVDLNDFDVFLKAKRDLGFAEVGRKIRGSDPEMAQRTIEALSRKYDISFLERVASDLYQYQDEGLRKLLDAGFIGKDAYNRIKAQNKYYVPFERIMDTVDNYLGIPTSKAQQAVSPIKKIKGSERKIISPIESIIANTYKIEAAVAKNRVAKSLVDLRNLSPNYKDIFVPAKKSGTNTISVWENGKKQFYQVPEDIAKAVKGLNEEELGTLVKILSTPARILRQGATGRNIDFMIPNVFKDQLDAAVSSKYGYRPFIDYFRGLAHLVNYRRTGSDELVEQYLKSGGSIFFGSMSGRKAIREQIKEATTKPALTKRLGKWLVEGIETIGEYSETPTRLGLFKRTLEKTSNPYIAALESREGTLDFARMGAKMRVANAIIPFLNVGIQGFDKMIRSAIDHPGRMAIAMATYGGLPAAMTAIYNNLFYPQELSEIPQWVRDSNFVIVKGRDKDGKVKYLTFPKGNIIPYIANPTEHFIAWLAGNDNEGFSKMALNTLTQGLPVIGSGGTIKEVISRTVGSNLPQAIKPIAEDVANYSFFRGKQIVPSYLAKKPPALQTYPWTPQLYQKIGRILKVSPLRVKNMMEGYLAGYVKMPAMAMETIRDIATGREPDINKTLVLRRFIGKTYKSGVPIKITREKPTTGGLLSGIVLARQQRKEQLTISQAAQDLGVDKYLGSPPSGAVPKAKWESDKFKAAVKVYRDETIDDDIKEKLLTQLGENSADVAYYDIATDDRSVRRAAVDEVLNEGGIEALTNLRREVNGKKILTNTIVDDLYEEGVITYAQRQYLKNVGKKGGRGTISIGKTPKFSFKALPSAPKTAGIRVSGRKGYPSRIKIKISSPPTPKPLTFGTQPIKIKSSGVSQILGRGIRTAPIRVRFGQ